MTVAAIPNPGLVFGPIDRDDTPERAESNERAEESKTEKIPTATELREALKDAPMETILEVRQKFVEKAFEDVFENYPDDFSFEKCELIPENKEEGMKSTRNGETSIYAEKFIGEDGKEYAHFWIDMGHPNPDENIRAAVVCQLDKDGKPVLDSQLNEQKAVISMMNEKQFDHSLKVSDKEPEASEKKLRLKPRLWKFVVFGAGGLLIPERADIPKPKNQYQAEMSAYHMSQLVKGKITPEQYSIATKSKERAQRWNKEKVSLRNERATKERWDELVERREFLDFKVDRLETRSSEAETQIINETEAAISDDENMMRLRNMLELAENLDEPPSEAALELIADQYGVSIEDLKVIQTSIRTGLEESEVRNILGDREAALQLLEEELEDFEGLDQIREDAVNTITRFAENNPDGDVVEMADRYYSEIYSMLVGATGRDEDDTRQRVYLLREMLEQDLRIQNRTDLVEALDGTAGNPLTTVNFIDTTATTERTEVTEEDLATAREAINGGMYRLMERFGAGEEDDPYRAFYYMGTQQYRDLINKGYSIDVAGQIVQGLEDEVIENVQEQGGELGGALVERIEDPYSTRTPEFAETEETVEEEDTEQEDTTVEVGNDVEEQDVEQQFVEKVNSMLTRIQERSIEENRSPTSVFTKGYRGQQINLLWEEYKEFLEYIGFSRNGLRDMIADLVRNNETEF